MMLILVCLPCGHKYKVCTLENIIYFLCSPKNVCVYEDALCQKNGLLDYSWKKKECIQLQEVDDMHDACDEVERMLIHIDEQSPNCLQDNILYYIGRYIV